MNFFDSSAIVAAYARQANGPPVRDMLRGHVGVSRLTEVEVVSALSRLAKEISLPDGIRDATILAFLADFSEWEVVEIVPEVTARARKLLLRHALRASDAIQLASALIVQARLAGALDSFVVCDRRLVQAARLENLTVIEE